MLCGARRFKFSRASASILTRINSISAAHSGRGWSICFHHFRATVSQDFFNNSQSACTIYRVPSFFPSTFFRIHSYKVSRSSKALHFRWGFIIPGNPIILSLSKLSISGPRRVIATRGALGAIQHCRIGGPEIYAQQWGQHPEPGAGWRWCWECRVVTVWPAGGLSRTRVVQFWFTCLPMDWDVQKNLSFKAQNFKSSKLKSLSAFRFKSFNAQKIRG